PAHQQEGDAGPLPGEEGTHRSRGLAEPDVPRPQPVARMSFARCARPVVLALARAGPCGAGDFSGYVRPEYLEQAAAARGPLAAANSLVPGIASAPRSGPEIDAELRASGYGLTGVAALQAERQEGDRLRAQGRFDELYWSGSRSDWQ